MPTVKNPVDPVIVSIEDENILEITFDDVHYKQQEYDNLSYTFDKIAPSPTILSGTTFTIEPLSIVSITSSHPPTLVFFNLHFFNLRSH